MDSSSVKTPFFVSASATGTSAPGTQAAALNIDDLFGDCFFTPNGETGERKEGGGEGERYY